jgi:hypothetical protein
MSPISWSSNAEVVDAARMYHYSLELKGIIRVAVDSGDIDQALLLKKDYQAAKAIDITDNCLVLDPSMPRKRVRCPRY